MDTVVGVFQNGLLTLKFNGHIDSSNANAVEAEIKNIKDQYPGCQVVIDCDNLKYISSAGLRIILRLKKENKELKLLNVSSEVYEVFEMTGFTEMMTVEKAYRKLSVEGCEVIGQGANGKVYRLDPDTIIKVYLNPDSLPDIQRERELARKAFVLGIPTAIPYDVVRVDGSYGSVFELLNAQSFAKLLMKSPDNFDSVVDKYVDLLKKIHSTEVKPGDMPDMKAVAIGWAKFLEKYIPADKYEKLIKLINDVPERTTMLHGDYHLKNVMLQDGETLLIDMDTLCVGHPVFEFASIYLAYVGYSGLDHSITLSFLGIPHDIAGRIWKETVKRYFGTDDEAKLLDYENKAKVIGYTRMLRRTIRRTPDDTALIEHCKEQLCSSIDKVDTLDF